MYLTEQEILDTPNALARTCAYFDESSGRIRAFFANHPEKRFVFFGCGSSYMLAKGAATLFGSFPGTSASAIAGGDYVVDPEFWKETVRGSIVVSLSRSGRTSEMVKAMKDIKASLGCPIISVSMEPDNDIDPVSDLSLTMDWCYDRSVCQTRTVANLYAASLLLAAEYSGRQDLRNGVRAAAETNAAFQKANRPVLEAIAAKPWTNAVVLADGAVCGIAEEAALAFTEIAMLTGRYFHFLDYRHGPIVISGEKTLTLILLRPGSSAPQEAMVRDVIAHGGIVVTASEEPGNPFGSDAHFCLAGMGGYDACGIALIYLAQMTAFSKAVQNGGNPDAPTGLDAYITLNL